MVSQSIRDLWQTKWHRDMFHTAPTSSVFPCPDHSINVLCSHFSLYYRRFMMLPSQQFNKNPHLSPRRYHVRSALAVPNGINLSRFSRNLQICTEQAVLLPFIINTVLILIKVKQRNICFVGTKYEYRQLFFHINRIHRRDIHVQ